MYIGSILNRKGLFQHVGGWKSSCEALEQRQLEVFLFRATSAILNLERMYFLSRLCVEQFEQRKDELQIRSATIVLWSPTFVEMLNEFSPFLSSMRIMQNMILPLAVKARKLRVSVPSSLADAMSKLDRYGLDDETCNSIREYWNDGGKEIKGYRDIDQHYYAIVEHSFLQVSPDVKVLIYLPDNPEEKNENRVSFASERNALVYFEDAFVRLHNCVEKIAAASGFQPKPIDQSVGLSQVGTLSEGMNKTLALLIEDTEELSGFELGQTEERKIYVRRIFPKNDRVANISASSVTAG